MIHWKKPKGKIMSLIKNLLILLFMAAITFQFSSSKKNEEPVIKEVKIVKINHWSIYR